MAGRNTYFQDEVIEKKIDLQQLGRTIRYILPHKKQVILAAVLMFSVSVVALIPPILLKTIINHTVVVKDPQELIGIIVAMACFALLEIGITFGQARVMGRLGHTIIAEIREEIFDQLQKLPFEYFDNRPNGKIVVRVTEYINGLANFFTNYFMTFFAMLVKLIIVTIFMIYYSPILTLAVYASVGPMMALIFFIRYKVRQLFSVHRAKVSNRTAFLIESIMGERIVKYYDRMETNEDINLDVHMQSVHQWWRIVVRMELNSPVVIAFWNIGTLLIYGIAFAMILSGTGNMTAGVVILFTQYMMQFTQPLQTLAQIIQNLAEV
ncbi:MAG: ABC transporter ATP-binding protein, partial [Lachnospiraceae bacterium]|nr:ABC transporter ATP-binding protein [Lachnospiraceae bacterium]